MRHPIRFLSGVVAITGFAATFFVVGVARADELKLKDGTKITGSIVGFEDNAFKVMTNYGFALVEKDQVASISITPVAKAEDAEKKPESAADKTPIPALAKSAKPEATTASTAANSAATPAALAGPAPTAEIRPARPKPTLPDAPAAPTSANSVAPAQPANQEASLSAISAASPALPAGQPASMSAATKSVALPSATPPKPAASAPIRETVDGNTYTNETYGFQMYKPPDWQVIAGARTLLPGTIAAMGTDDQTTYLLIGQAPAGKTLASDEDAADRRLRDIMDNFRPLDVEHLTISGIAAIERRFRGSVDQHDWSGVVVLVPRGAQLYTIFGMTLADTDLVQIQENVLARAISSLQFTKQ